MSNDPAVVAVVAVVADVAVAAVGDAGAVEIAEAAEVAEVVAGAGRYSAVVQELAGRKGRHQRQTQKNHRNRHRLYAMMLQLEQKKFAAVMPGSTVPDTPVMAVSPRSLYWYCCFDVV